MPDPKTPDKPSLRELADYIKREWPGGAMAALAEAVADEVERIDDRLRKHFKNDQALAQENQRLKDRLAEIERRLDALPRPQSPPARQPTRHLTLDEQEAMTRALRASSTKVEPTTTDGGGG